MNNLCSENEHLKHRALIRTRLVLIRDSYSRNLMLDALSSSEFRNSSEYQELVESSKSVDMTDFLDVNYWRKWSLMIGRHCDARGRIIHLVNDSLSSPNTSGKGCEECTTEHVWTCPSILWVEYHYGKPDLLQNVVPVIAGHLKNGAEGYMVKDREGFFIHNSDQAKAAPSLCLAILRYTPDFYTPSNLSQRSGDMESALSIRRFELQLYASDFYMQFYASRRCIATSGGLDATGPYSWEFVRDLPRLKEIQDEEDEVYDWYNGESHDTGTVDDEAYYPNSCDAEKLHEAERDGTHDTDSVSDVASFITALEDIPAQ